MVFYSKSAILSEEKRSEHKMEVKVLTVKLQRVSLLGSPNIVLPSGIDSFNVSDKSVESIYGCLALVVHSTIYDGKTDGYVSFAKEYGIPIIWFGDKRPPENKLFNYSLVTSNKMRVWEYLCQIK